MGRQVGTWGLGKPLKPQISLPELLRTVLLGLGRHLTCVSVAMWFSMGSPHINFELLVDKTAVLRHANSGDLSSCTQNEAHYWKPDWGMDRLKFRVYKVIYLC